MGNKESSDDYHLSYDVCQELRQILVRNGVNERVVPYYLPEGYELCDSSVETTYLGTIVTAVYRNGNNEIILLYTIDSPESSSLFPKDQAEPQEYVFEGVTHFVFLNEEEWAAVWQHNDIGCQISGVGSRAELLKIINSIYEGK